MSLSRYIWLGLFVGSGLGGMVPLLWDAELFSFAGVIGSTVGGALGIWAGYRVGRSVGA